MKEYMKPVVEVVAFTTERITTDVTPGASDGDL